jgi:hypothetical protein
VAETVPPQNVSTLGHEPGLADTRLTADQPDPATLASRRAERGVMQLPQLRVPSDQRFLD